MAHAAMAECGHTICGLSGSSRPLSLDHLPRWQAARQAIMGTIGDWFTADSRPFPAGSRKFLEAF